MNVLLYKYPMFLSFIFHNSYLIKENDLFSNEQFKYVKKLNYSTQNGLHNFTSRPKGSFLVLFCKNMRHEKKSFTVIRIIRKT